MSVDKEKIEKVLTPIAFTRTSLANPRALTKQNNECLLTALA